MNLIGSYMVQEFKRLHNSFKKGCKEMTFFFYYPIDCLYSLHLDFVGPCGRNNHVRKHVKLFIETYVFIFWNFGLCQSIDA
jgi:hypothetical protein